MHARKGPKGKRN